MLLFRRIALSLLLLVPTASFAEEGGGEGLESLTEYLKNLGSHFGFDVTQPAENPLATLLDASSATLAQQYSFITLLGAIPVNAYSDAFAAFVPPDVDSYSWNSPGALFGRHPLWCVPDRLLW